MAGPAARLLDLLYPRRCMFCRRILEQEPGILCEACSRSLKPAPQGKKRGDFYQRCVSVCAYEGKVRNSILRYKFGGCSFYAEVYGRLLARVIREELEGAFDRITYVPISRKRLRRRGYDQARLLAEAVGRELDVPVLRTTIKIKNTRPQSRISGAADRRKNIQNAYRAVDPEAFAGLRLLLIDDVLTTGATLTEVSRVLLSHGAESVCCATFAVTPN